MQTKTILVVLFSSLIALMALPSFADTDEPSGHPVHDMQVFTPTGGEVKLDRSILYVGFSQNQPCSDLQSFLIGDLDISIKNGSDIVYSGDLLEMQQYPGQPITCMRADLTVQGKTRSTGNIRLILNADHTDYVGSQPRSSVLDFRS